MRISGALDGLKNLVSGGGRQELESLVALASQDLHDVIGCFKSNPDLIKHALGISHGSDPRGTMISFDWITACLEHHCYNKQIVRRDATKQDDYICLFYPVQGQQKESISAISGYWDVKKQTLLEARIDHYFAPHGQVQESFGCSIIVTDSNISDSILAVEMSLSSAGSGNEWVVNKENDGIGVSRSGAKPRPKLIYYPLQLELIMTREELSPRVLFVANTLDSAEELLGTRDRRDAWATFKN